MISDLFSQIRANNRQIDTLLTLVDNLHYENRQLTRRIESRQVGERNIGHTGEIGTRWRHERPRNRGATGPGPRNEPERNETGIRQRENVRNVLSENRTEDDIVFYFYLPRRDETGPAETEPRGLTPEIISQETTQSLFNEIENPNNLSCPISLETFQPEQSVIMINQCRHIFNTQHLTRWFETKTTCPMCRRNIHSDPPLNRLANMASQMFSNVITTGVNDILNDLRI